jgi:hypothetical protein
MDTFQEISKCFQFQYIKAYFMDTFPKINKCFQLTYFTMFMPFEMCILLVEDFPMGKKTKHCSLTMNPTSKFSMKWSFH